MLRINIIYASRYGATKEVAWNIAESLRESDCYVELTEANVAILTGFDAYILGSGIYANRLLSDMEDFIAANMFAMAKYEVAIFGVAMSTEPVERNGKVSGGVHIFEKYPVKPFAKAVLHGRMDFSALSDEDKSGLELFYKAIGLTEEQKTERKRLRDEISPDECRSFAREILSALIIDE
jgi:menaquinone-dependent protoporphyrinogen oxidase